jgi:NAD dependent epimerase/dehydratase family enzyme
MLHLFLGQMAQEILLKGTEAKPEVLLNSGFTFKYKNFADFTAQT